jgi:hypothetical protein
MAPLTNHFKSIVFVYLLGSQFSSSLSLCSHAMSPDHLPRACALLRLWCACARAPAHGGGSPLALVTGPVPPIGDRANASTSTEPGRRGSDRHGGRAFWVGPQTGWIELGEASFFWLLLSPAALETGKSSTSCKERCLLGPFGRQPPKIASRIPAK